MVGRNRQRNEATLLQPEDVAQTLQRRLVRKEYKELLNKTAETKNDLANPDQDTFATRLQAANDIFIRNQNVISAPEAYADAKVLAYIAKCGVEQANHLEGEFSTFTTKEFAQRFRSKYEDEDGKDVDWVRAGEIAGANMIYTPAVRFMFGPLATVAIKAEKRKGRQPLKRQKLEEAVSAEKIAVDEDDADELTTRVSLLEQALVKNQKVSYYDFVVNPKSFAETVENMFDFSVLVKHNSAQLEKGNKGELIAESIPAGDPRHKPTSVVGRRQCIMKMDQKLWANLAQVKKTVAHEAPDHVSSMGTIATGKVANKGKKRKERE